MSKNESFKNMLIECFGTTVKPGIVAGASMINPLAGILATAYFASQDSYRYTRAERNLELAIEDLYSKYEAIESKLLGSQNKKVKEQLFPLFWDYVIDEQEEEKIQLFVNGVVVAISKEEINMEKMYVYFDILKNLRLKEIHYFIDVYINQNFKVVEGENSRVDFNPKNLDVAYHNYVLNKLERLGLITLAVISGNGTIDEHYNITSLGEELNNYFNTL
ncbi:hypothetical protein ACFWGC_29535 [Cytobacillus pseudoceanisediminis]|uniref:hypothetical protein n=1 Tax=Bacillaceae TaxID=186817 RepID=UPI001A8E759F|nr:hypothetical protein [Bacillus sp. NTK034]MBN8199181.1 hypothetical protein [Bacillus sp. NTK034]